MTLPKRQKSAQPTLEQAMQFMADAVLYQRIDLTGPWQGWKIRGQYLVSPDRERIMVRELIGLLIHYRAKFEHHRSKAKQQAAPSNVISFAAAAVEQLRARAAPPATKKPALTAPAAPAAVTEAAGSPRAMAAEVQGGALRGA